MWFFLLGISMIIITIAIAFKLKYSKERIRKFRQDDTEQVMRIWLEGNLQAHDFIPKYYWTSHYDLMKEMLPQAEIFVYESHGQIRGFVGMTGCYLAGIFIDGNYQSTGLGKKLLNHIKARYPVFTLNVYEKNKGAVNFYLREGLLLVSRQEEAETGAVDLTMAWEEKAGRL